MQESIQKQRDANKRRLEERRRKRDEKQYEEDLALSIISSADKSFNLMKEKSSQQKAKQHDSVGPLYVVYSKDTKEKLHKWTKMFFI